MKKLLIIGAVLVLLLAACSSRISGETTTVCENTGVSPWGIGETTVTIEGMDEDILIWRVEVIFDREEYNNQFWGGMEPTDADITQWFDSPESQNLEGINGVNWYLVSLDDDTLVTEIVYYYEEMSEGDLNNAWDVDSFEREVTLSGAIGGLEDEGATCQTD